MESTTTDETEPTTLNMSMTLAGTVVTTATGSGMTDLTSERSSPMGGGDVGGNGVGGIIGGVVGVGVVILLLLVLVIVVVVVLKRRTSWKPQETTEGQAFPNAIYGTGKHQKSTPPPTFQFNLRPKHPHSPGIGQLNDHYD